MKMTKELFEEQLDIANKIATSFYFTNEDMYKDELKHLREDLTNPDKSFVQDGVLYWRLPNENRVTPLDVAGYYYAKMHGDIDLVKHHRAEVAQSRAWIKSYRESMKDYEPSEEEKMEMRAAYGENAKVIDVFTGKVIQL